MKNRNQKIHLRVRGAEKQVFSVFGGSVPKDFRQNQIFESNDFQWNCQLNRIVSILFWAIDNRKKKCCDLITIFTNESIYLRNDGNINRYTEYRIVERLRWLIDWQPDSGDGKLYELWLCNASDRRLPNIYSITHQITGYTQGRVGRVFVIVSWIIFLTKGCTKSEA